MFGFMFGFMFRFRFVIPLIASIAIVLSGPYMGQLRGVLQAALPTTTYRAVLGSAVLLAVAGAVVAAVVRIRERRARRYGAIALGLAIAVIYARATATGNANVDLVERVHFVEYGLLALLFFRVWRERGDLSTLALPALACIVVAFVDEWFQWFVPGRVGEIRDVALDGVAIASGLLCALGLDPPRRLVPRLPPRPAITMAALSSAAILIAALFIGVIHVGHEISLGSSTLRSRFTRVELEELARERTERWTREGAPTALRRLSREDQYLAEGIWHVQRRNEAAGAGDVLAAWRENSILERLFAPVLDWPSYAAPSPSRWPPEQRADLEARSSSDARPYASRAHPFPLYTWNRPLFWAFTGSALLGALWCCLR
jgi:VanZ family protein